MVGAIGAAILLVKNQVGGLDQLLVHENVAPKLNLLPSISDKDLFISLLVIPLAVQWWSVWYPGAEPGGGGYIAQRMLSAKNEKNALGATLLFNFFHYAVRPWPWIFVALASLVIFFDIASLQNAFPHLDPQYIKHDMAYPAMLTLLPHGFLGLIVASLIAAFMSTTASQINWGSSYIVNDFYSRFVNPNATEKQKVFAGRVSTVVLMIFAILFALLLENALQAFHILLQIGAGTGLIYILRWFWWRINAYTELTGMIVSFIVAITFAFVDKYSGFELTEVFKITTGVLITTVAWIIVTLLTPKTDKDTLRKFYVKIKPGGPGWRRVVEEAQAEKVELMKDESLKWDVPTGILCMIAGCIAVYFCLFGVGYFLYGNAVLGSVYVGISVIAALALTRLWKKLKLD
jgi:solute:Na+ symporter, SSS family